MFGIYTANAVNARLKKKLFCHVWILPMKHTNAEVYCGGNKSPQIFYDIHFFQPA